MAILHRKNRTTSAAPIALSLILISLFRYQNPRIWLNYISFETKVLSKSHGKEIWKRNSRKPRSVRAPMAVANRGQKPIETQSGNLNNIKFDPDGFVFQAVRMNKHDGTNPRKYSRIIRSEKPMKICSKCFYSSQWRSYYKKRGLKLVRGAVIAHLRNQSHKRCGSADQGATRGGKQDESDMRKASKHRREEGKSRDGFFLGDEQFPSWISEDGDIQKGTRWPNFSMFLQQTISLHNTLENC